MPKPRVVECARAIVPSGSGAGATAVITQTGERDIVLSDHATRRKLHDWYAHQALNKRCPLFEMCNNFKEFLEWEKTSCLNCFFKSATEDAKGAVRDQHYAIRKVFYTRLDVKRACRDGAVTILALPDPQVLVYLDEYEAAGFEFGSKRGGAPREPLFEFRWETVEIDTGLSKESFAVIVDGETYPLETADLEEAKEQAKAAKDFSAGEIVLKRYCRGTEEIVEI
jgi:hypothetical protein